MRDPAITYGQEIFLCYGSSMARYSEALPLTDEQFREIADQLAHMAARYRQLADTMKERGIETIQAQNLKTLADATLAIQRACNLSHAELDAEILRSGIIGTFSKPFPLSDTDEAESEVRPRRRRAQKGRDNE
jgi:hypothetical protein